MDSYWRPQRLPPPCSLSSLLQPESYVVRSWSIHMEREADVTGVAAAATHGLVSR